MRLKSYVMANPEKHASPEEIKAVLRKPLPLKAKKVFGALNIKQLMDMMANPLFDEADRLVNLDGIPFEEVDEYLMASEESQQMFAGIFSMARQFADSFDMEKLLKETVKSIQTGKVQQGLFGVALDFSDLMDSLCEIGKHSFRNGKMIAFNNSFFEYLCLNARRVCVKSKNGAGYKKAFEKFLSIQDQFYQQNYRNGFPGMVVLRFLENLEVSRKKYDTGWDALCKMEEGEALAELEADNAMKFDYVRDLSEFRKIPFRVRQNGQSAILTVADDMESFKDYKIGAVSFFRIKLSPDIGFPKIDEYKDANGNNALYFRFREGVVDLCLDRSTGRLTFALCRVPISKFIGQDKCEVLKKKILDFLIDLLEEKKTPQQEPKADVIEKTRDEIAAALQPEKPAVKSEEPAVQSEESILDNAEDISLQALEEEVDSNTVRTLRAFNPNDIYTKLVRFLGREIRSSGSHFIFRCRNGRTYPIALHFGRKKVGMGMLKKCLKHFGIGVEEFCLG